MASESATSYPPQPAAEIASTFWSTEQRLYPYSVYDIFFSYRGSMGVLLLPVSGQPTDAQAGTGQGGGASAMSAEIIQLSAPWMIVRAEWKAYRTGQPPQIPDFRPPSGSSKYVLSSFDVGGKDACPASNGKDYVFTSVGWVEYFLKEFLTPDDGYPMGASPTQTLSTSALGVTAEQFNQTIFPL